MVSVETDLGFIVPKFLWFFACFDLFLQFFGPKNPEKQILAFTDGLVLTYMKGYQIKGYQKCLHMINTKVVHCTTSPY